MLEVAEVFRLHGAAFRARFGHRLFPAQLRALHDIEACRTAVFGGHLKQCDRCGHQVYAYHSCGNRHCPKCHGKRTERWLEKQQARLLPCTYYLLTFTLPQELRALAIGHQKKVYGWLMRVAAAALQKLADDPRYVGARLGILAVLHTWTRAMLYHPHVHLLVTGGGLSVDGTRWIEPKNPAFLVPVEALSVIFRAKMCAALKKAGLLEQVSPTVWKKNWVVHCRHAGTGRKVLEYLGRYVFRVAISNSRLDSIDNDQVAFRYRDNRTQEIRRVTLSGVEFIRRFLTHVLPRGCAKVRYYGIWSASCRPQLNQAQALMSSPPSSADLDSHVSMPDPTTPIPTADRCPQCRLGHLILIEVLHPRRKVPP